MADSTRTRTRTRAEWRQLELSRLQDRLGEVSRLLEQAAALAGAQDRDRIHAMARLQAPDQGGGHDHPRRRRFR